VFSKKIAEDGGRVHYNLLMIVPPPPFFPWGSAAIHTLITLTFLVQAVVIAFHTRLGRQFAGIGTYLTATVLLAAGGLVPPLHGRLGPELSGLLSAVFLIWGQSLQVLAVTLFLKRRVSRRLVLGWPTITTVIMLASFFAGAPPPLVALRELFPLPLLIVAAVSIWRTDTRSFRAGAILTAIPFALYGVRSLLRFITSSFHGIPDVLGLFANETADAMTYFVFNLLWTSGFLLMINQRLQSSLETLATEDPLTGCLNRRAMLSRLDIERLRHVRHGRPFTIVLMDLDRFKSINDTRGHDVGDLVLTRTTAAMRHAVRTEDAVARWGGEEFLVLLPETEEREAFTLTDRLRSVVASLEFEQGLKVTISGGLATATGEESVAELCRRADEALYEAKKTRNRIVAAS
jgi:diguanylate cyclase (GGDEF)-like protein